MSWELQKLEKCCGQAEINHAEVYELAINLSNFIAKCPNDFLEPLFNSPFGRVYKIFLDRCCTTTPSSSEATTQRDLLSNQLRISGFKGLDGHRLLLATMPFYPSGSMTVEDAISKLPEWLYQIYCKRYEETNISKGGAESEAQKNNNLTVGFSNRIFLNKILGLSNLYYIDPEDQDIVQELREIRLQCIELILKASLQELSENFLSDFGDRYWAMAQSGIQKEPLTPKETLQREGIQKWLTTTSNSLNQDGGLQRFIAILLFTQPGSIQLANPEENLPRWFSEGFKRYNSMAAAN
jgi:hypothetical protein